MLQHTVEYTSSNTHMISRFYTARLLLHTGEDAAGTGPQVDSHHRRQDATQPLHHCAGVHRRHFLRQRRRSPASAQMNNCLSLSLVSTSIGRCI